MRITGFVGWLVWGFAHIFFLIGFRSRIVVFLEWAWEWLTYARGAAIEIYKKPSFRYREETFSILMLNAWQLLLKARILKENKNHLRSIKIWETRKTNSGGARVKSNDAEPDLAGR